MSTETSTKLAFFKELGKCQDHSHGACRLLGSDRLQRFRVRWCVTPYFVSAAFASAFMLKMSNPFYCAPTLVTISDLPFSRCYAQNTQESSRQDLTRFIR
jgi:hypothetical protein